MRLVYTRLLENSNTRFLVNVSEYCTFLIHPWLFLRDSNGDHY